MERFTFGMDSLYGGIETVSMIIGLIAVKEVIVGLEEEQVAVSAGNHWQRFSYREGFAPEHRTHAARGADRFLSRASSRLLADGLNIYVL